LRPRPRPSSTKAPRYNVGSSPSKRRRKNKPARKPLPPSSIASSPSILPHPSPSQNNTPINETPSPFMPPPSTTSSPLTLPSPIPLQQHHCNKACPVHCL
jgi:hypothetical protein